MNHPIFKQVAHNQSLNPPPIRPLLYFYDPFWFGNTQSAGLRFSYAFIVVEIFHCPSQNLNHHPSKSVTSYMNKPIFQQVGHNRSWGSCSTSAPTSESGIGATRFHSAGSHLKLSQVQTLKLNKSYIVCSNRKYFISVKSNIAFCTFLYCSNFILLWQKFQKVKPFLPSQLV